MMKGLKKPCSDEKPEKQIVCNGCSEPPSVGVCENCGYTNIILEGGFDDNSRCYSIEKNGYSRTVLFREYIEKYGGLEGEMSILVQNHAFVVSEFERDPPLDRKKFINNQYLLLKFLQKNGHSVQSKLERLMSDDALRRNDKILKIIYDRLGWEFIESCSEIRKVESCRNGRGPDRVKRVRRFRRIPQMSQILGDSGCRPVGSNTGFRYCYDNLWDRWRSRV